ncbi:MAG: diaminopimelate epimerase [Candidatus Methanofastidiosa archaeon]|nr:diaminopimelate epimerase [Candidatus Methanofastidiosa archaeon]
MRFTKMEGLGNDYVYVDLFAESLPNIDLPSLARAVSDRHFGIGSDGLVLILPSEVGECRMRMFNSDGSEAEMCGNAVRCIAKLMFNAGRHKNGTVRIETMAGIIVANVRDVDNLKAYVEVDMGPPVFDPKRIPVLAEGNEALDIPIEIEGRELRFNAVSMGNPHCVIFADEVDDRMVHGLGPKIENHRLFPEKTNVEFVKVSDRGNIEMRVWERGAGETLACGTGACASVAACIRSGLCDHTVDVRLLGGTLTISWPENDTIRMKGPARIVFTGEMEL